MSKRKPVDPAAWAVENDLKHSGKIVNRPDVVDWLRKVIEMRASGASGVSYLKIAAFLRDPDTDPHLQVSEAGIRHFVREQWPDLYRRARHGQSSEG